MVETFVNPSRTQHTITALVQNETGTINRLVSLFRRRGFSLACFNAGDCEQPGFSRITLVVNGNQEQLQQCLKQLDKLIDVIEVSDLAPSESVSRELALIKVQPHANQRDSLFEVVSRFSAKTPMALGAAIVVEISAGVTEIENLIAELAPFQITQIVRTGTVAIHAGAVDPSEDLNHVALTSKK